MRYRLQQYSSKPTQSLLHQRPLVMKITQPDGSGTVDVSQKWEIRWEDVVEYVLQYRPFPL